MEPFAYIYITSPAHRGWGNWRNKIMKTWTKPAVREQEVGLEVTSYLPAEIDVI
jgi:coenzyme PQQ precursor peptide PqqA